MTTHTQPDRDIFPKVGNTVTPQRADFKPRVFGTAQDMREVIKINGGETLELRNNCKPLQKCHRSVDPDRSKFIIGLQGGHFAEENHF